MYSDKEISCVNEQKEKHPPCSVSNGRKEKTYIHFTEQSPRKKQNKQKKSTKCDVVMLEELTRLVIFLIITR